MTGGGPFFSPGLLDMVKLPIWVLPMSSRALSNTRRTGIDCTRSLSHSTCAGYRVHR